MPAPTGTADPIIVSVDGTLHLTDAIHISICDGEIDAEGAYARFHALCAALWPQSSAKEVFEAQEGFWRLEGAKTPQTLVGELGWFQIEHLQGVPAPMLVPLLVHAATEAIAQLGSLSFSSVSIQIPTVGAPLDPVWVQTLLDQFAAAKSANTPTEVAVQLFARSRPRLPYSAIENWFERTYTGDIAVRSLDVKSRAAVFDDRWALRSPLRTLRGTFEIPEWSAAGVSTLAVFMLASAQTAKVDGPVIITVERCSAPS